MKIDFRSHYNFLSYISFMATIYLYLQISKMVDISNKIGVPNRILNKQFVDLFLNIGVFVTIFQGLLFIYNKKVWKHIGYKEIDVSGYWKYTIRSGSNEPRVGYAEIKQDMYDILIYGFNAGSGKSHLGVGIWKSSNTYISNKTLYYDYDLFAEKPGRDFRMAKGHATVELINPQTTFWQKICSSKPIQLVGSWYDIPSSNKKASNVGSIFFERIESDKLPEVVRNQFQDNATISV